MKLSAKIATTLTLIVALVTLTGCVPEPPSEGFIVAKTFTPAHEEIYTVAVDTYDYGCRPVSRFNSDGDYITTTECGYYYGDHGEREERTRFVPDRWTILFEGENSDGELDRRTIQVSEAIFEQAREGYSITVEDEEVFIGSR